MGLTPLKWYLKHRGKCVGGERPMCIWSKTGRYVTQWPPGPSGKVSDVWELWVAMNFLSIHLWELICLFFLLHFNFLLQLQRRALAAPEGQACVGFSSGTISSLVLHSACQLCSSSGSVTWGVKTLFYPSQFNSEMEIQTSLLGKIWSGKNGSSRGYEWCCKAWSLGHGMPFAHVNTQQLQLPLQDVHKDLSASHHWRREVFLNRGMVFCLCLGVL